MEDSRGARRRTCCDFKVTLFTQSFLKVATLHSRVGTEMLVKLFVTLVQVNVKHANTRRWRLPRPPARRLVASPASCTYVPRPPPGSLPPEFNIRRRTPVCAPRGQSQISMAACHRHDGRTGEGGMWATARPLTALPL